MSDNQPTLPDNLKSRVSRLFRRDRSFNNDNGESVEYSRLVLECLVKGEIFEIEVKIDKKDWALLSLADVVDGGSNPLV